MMVDARCGAVGTGWVMGKVNAAKASQGAQRRKFPQPDQGRQADG